MAASALLVFPATSGARPRALIAFLPSAPESGQPLLGEFAHRGMAIGMTSPTVGGFNARQMALDMSQGTRIPTRLYSKRIGSLRLCRGHGGEWELAGWDIAKRRAEKAPGDLVPGLLASALDRAGRSVAYVGILHRYALGAIVAADETGRVAGASLGTAGTVAERAARAFRVFDLVVADLPSGRAGLRALDRLLAVRGRDGFVYIVRAPRGKELRLLASGVAAAGIHGQLRSDTTRRNGLIAAIDVAPTVLDRLRVPVPDEMQGQTIEGRGRTDPEAVRKLADRLAVITSRRADCLRWLLGMWLGALALLSLLFGERGALAALRIGLLGALWVPGVALLNAALAPGRTKEAAVLAGGSLLLGLITDLLVRWPAAPAVPALVVFVAHLVDLARGSPLIGKSIAGPNPAGGARFFGIGNELETMLSFAVLVGTGAALAWVIRNRPPPFEADAPGYHPEDEEPYGEMGRAAPWTFALVAVFTAGVMGAGRLGADVGAVITLGAGAAAAVVVSLPGGPSRRAIAIAIVAPVAGIGALIVLDLVTGGGAHLTRSVLHAGSTGDLADVVRRRFQGSTSSLHKPAQAAAFAIAVALVVLLAVYRERVLSRLAQVRGGQFVRAGLTGAFFGVVVGALSNDSGPLILEIGAVLLTLAAAYAWARPVRWMDAQ